VSAVSGHSPSTQQALPGWLHFNTSSRVLVGLPIAPGDLGSILLTISSRTISREGSDLHNRDQDILEDVFQLTVTKTSWNERVVDLQDSNRHASTAEATRYPDTDAGVEFSPSYPAPSEDGRVVNQGLGGGKRVTDSAHYRHADEGHDTRLVKQEHPNQLNPTKKHTRKEHFKEEHPKQEHPKQEHPKQRHSKQDHPMGHPNHEHPKQEHPKQQHPKQQHLKQGHPMIKHPNLEGPKQKHHNHEHPKQEHPKQEHPKQEHPKQEHPKQKHPNHEYPKQGHPMKKHPNQEHPKQEHPKQEHPKQEHPKQEHPNQEHPNQEHPNQEHHMKDHSKQEHPMKKNLQQEHPMLEHRKQEHPKQEHPKQEHPKQEHPKQEHPNQEHPKQGGGCEEQVLASLVVCTSLSALTVTERVDMVSRLAQFLGIPFTSVTLASSDTRGLVAVSDGGFQLVSAGPGSESDSGCALAETAELLWPLECVTVRHLADLSRVIQHNVDGGRFREELGGRGLIGWYVASSDSLATRRHRRRYRRGAGQGAGSGYRTATPTPAVPAVKPTRIVHVSTPQVTPALTHVTFIASTVESIQPTAVFTPVTAQTTRQVSIDRVSKVWSSPIAPTTTLDSIRPTEVFTPATSSTMKKFTEFTAPALSLTPSHAASVDSPLIISSTLRVSTVETSAHPVASLSATPPLRLSSTILESSTRHGTTTHGDQVSRMSSKDILLQSSLQESAYPAIPLSIPSPSSALGVISEDLSGSIVAQFSEDMSRSIETSKRDSEVLNCLLIDIRLLDCGPCEFTGRTDRAPESERQG
ncbi:hypothetical protein EGW08_023592, partial [Elysia chlorotica]